MNRCCEALTGKFDQTYAARQLAARDTRGPPRTTSMLAELIAPADADDAGVEGRSLLDVGGGIGSLQDLLFARGLATATHVEVSAAFSRAARELAQRAGWAERVRFETGDFIQLADRLPDADIVTLDRVVCCYPDMPALVDRSAARARHLYALSAPRDGRLVRAFIGLENVVRRLRKDPFRTFVHPWSAIDDRLRAGGLEPVREATTPIWRMVVYRREGPEPGAR